MKSIATITKYLTYFIAVSAVAILAIWAGFSHVLFTSKFCFREFRYLSQEEIIEKSVKHDLGRISHYSGFMYKNAKDFFLSNPNCCIVYGVWPEAAYGISIYIKKDNGKNSLLSNNISSANVRRELTVYSHLNGCGDVLESYSINDRIGVNELT